MDFETIVYLKDLKEIENAYKYKPAVMIWWRVEAVIFLLFSLIIFFATGDFMKIKNIAMFFISLALLVLSFLHPKSVSRLICKTLVSLSNGQETITFRYSLRNQYILMRNMNTNKTSEFHVSDVVICKETTNYLIYFLADKRFFYVEKSMKELEAFKRLFHPKKYYILKD